MMEIVSHLTQSVMAESIASMEVMNLTVVSVQLCVYITVYHTIHCVGCPVGYAKCPREEKCIPQAWFCDGGADCGIINGTASDEMDCSKCLIIITCKVQVITSILCSLCDIYFSYHSLYSSHYRRTQHNIQGPGTIVSCWAHRHHSGVHHYGWSDCSIPCLPHTHRLLLIK